MKRHIRTISNVALPLIITAILFVALASETSISDFLKLGKSTDRSLLSAFILTSLLSLFVRTYRYKWILEKIALKEKTPRFGEMLIVTGVRNALVDFFPLRLGELSFFYILRQYGIPLSASTTVFGICTALDISVLFLIVSIVAGVTLIGGEQEIFLQLVNKDLTFNTIAVVALLILFVVSASFYLDFFAKLAYQLASKISARLHSPLLARVRDWLGEVARQLHRLRAEKSYFTLVLLTLLLRVGKYGSLYILLLAIVKQFGLGFSEIPLLLTTISFIAAEASASLPISGIMGFGTYEGAWIFVLSIMKLELPKPLSVVIVLHLITQVLGYSIATLAALVFLKQRATRKDA